MTVSQILVGWLSSSLILLLLKWRMLGDPYYWDELGCYVAQVHEMTHRLGAYLGSRPAYVRSPLMMTVLTLLHRYVSESRVLLHGAMVVVCSLTLPATYAITCELGGTRRTGAMAAVLCGLVPAFFAQASLVQMDLPATGVCAFAFLCLLRRNLLGYAVFGSLAVLIKESTYWVCLAAAILVYARLVVQERRPALAIGTLLRLWPTAIPGGVLFLWLLVHGRITGTMIAGDHLSELTLGGCFTSILHNLVEGGRLPLSVAAGAYLVHLYHRHRQKSSPGGDLQTEERRLDTWAAAILWLTLPLCFPGHLIRYMLPTLPALCSLAALGIALLPEARRVGAAALIALFLVSGFRADSFHDNGPSELEGNLSYRRLLQEQRLVARRIAESGVRRAVADFPFYNLLGAPPIFGYLPTPLEVTNLERLHEPRELCSAEVVVVTQVSASSFPLIEKAKELGILHRWFIAAGADFPVGKGANTPRSARYDHSITVYRVSCPPS